MSEPKAPILSPGTEPAEVHWEALIPHVERGGLVLVKPGCGLSLQEAAYAIAQDQPHRVSAWIENGMLMKPTPEQIAKWNQTPQKLFFCFILQPYVIALEFLAN